MPHHLLIAHGSPDARHKAVMHTLANRVDERGLPCSVAFLEHDTPSVQIALEALRGPVVTLGMLLGPGYHATVDVPRLLIGAPAAVTIDDRGPLGTGTWLIPTVDRLIADAGGDPEAPVILATAGSTRAKARLALAGFASEMQRTRAGDVLVAVASGPGLSLEDAAARLSVDAVPASVGTPRAVVVPFMIAPGVLADRVVEVAERRGLCSTGTLAESPPFIDTLVGRLAG
jgi:sirohydrochlorin ferrochelatase